MSVTSVERAVQLLQAVPRGDGTLSDLSRTTGLPIATVSRIMGTLESTGAVQRTDKAYSIGPVLRALTDSDPVQYDLLGISRRHLQELAEASGETAGLVESDGDDLVHLGQVSTDHDVAVRDWTGFRIGAHAGCIGLAFMAHWPDTRIDAYLARPIERYVEQSVTDPAVIRERLDTIRNRGWFCTVDEYAQGVTTVAAPIRNRDGLGVGALHVHGPSFRFPGPRSVEHWGAALIERTDTINSILGWSPA